MLVLSRKKDEDTFLECRCPDGSIIRATVAILDIRGDKVRLGFDAPPEVNIVREEVFNNEISPSGK